APEPLPRPREMEEDDEVAEVLIRELLEELAARAELPVAELGVARQRPDGALLVRREQVLEREEALRLVQVLRVLARDVEQLVPVSPLGEVVELLEEARREV